MESLQEQNGRDVEPDLPSQRVSDASQLGVLALFDRESDTQRLLTDTLTPAYQDDEDREPHIIRGYN